MKDWIKNIVFIAAFFCAGCESDKNELVDADPYPAQIAIEVVDVAGNDLFSDEYNGCVDKTNIGQSITYTYKGETYPLNFDLNQKQPEIISDKVPALYRFYGVYLLESWGEPVTGPLLFGEFDGEEDQHEKVIVNWPDGTHTTIEFMSEACNAISSMKIRLDGGEWMNTPRVTIVK